MNKYAPGLVPVIMPQQFVVMPGAAVQLPPGHLPQGALHPAAMLHHQHVAAAQAAAAASHIQGTPAATNPGNLSAQSMGQQGMVSLMGAQQGMVSLSGAQQGMVSLPGAQQGMVSLAGAQQGLVSFSGLPPHLAGVAPPIMPAVSGAVPSMHPALSGLAASASPYAALAPLSSASQLLAQQQAAALQQQSPHLQLLQHPLQASFQQVGAGQDFKYADDDDEGYGYQSGSQLQAKTEPEVDELQLNEYLVTLDQFNSDLNLVIDKDGYGATVLTDPSGFCMTWAGVRATYGVCHGRVFFEVHVVEHVPTDFRDHQETDPHILRVGWSVDASSFQLGEDPWTFGYDGTGKFCYSNNFMDYAVRFEARDVIGAMLDLDTYPATISFMKNGIWYGVAAPLTGYPVGSKELALFPHVLSKNCRFKVNFGQQDPWFPPPLGFRYIGHMQLMERVRGMAPPERRTDCEVLMLIGLPGSGKTTLALSMQKLHPEKRYNIIGPDTLMDKMKVAGLPRDRSFSGGLEGLVDKATACINKLLTIASKRRRNYILDQTNVSSSARKQKMKNFSGFHRKAVVILLDDLELERRLKKRAEEDGKLIQESLMLEMKADFSLPEDQDGLFDQVEFVELQKDMAKEQVKRYNQEAKSKLDSSQTRFDGIMTAEDPRLQQYLGYSAYIYGKSDPLNRDPLHHQQNYWNITQEEPAAKRVRSNPPTALDVLKEQYEEQGSQLAFQQEVLLDQSDWSSRLADKEAEAAWSASRVLPGYLPGLAPSHIQPPPFHPGLLSAAQSGLYPGGVPLALIHHPGVLPQPSELSLLGQTGKAGQDSSPHPAMLSTAHPTMLAPTQLAELQAAAALQRQVMLNPTRLTRGSPYALFHPAASQSLYGAAPPGYESLVGQDSSSQIWQQAAAVAIQQQHLQNWHQMTEEDTAQQLQITTHSGSSSSFDWKKSEEDREKASKDSSFSKPGSKNKEHDANRDHTGFGYDGNKGHGKSDHDVRYSKKPWKNQNYGSGTSSEKRNFDANTSKLEQQRNHTSEYGQFRERGDPSADRKPEMDVGKFNTDQFQPLTKSSGHLPSPGSLSGRPTTAGALSGHPPPLGSLSGRPTPPSALPGHPPPLGSLSGHPPPTGSLSGRPPSSSTAQSAPTPPYTANQLPSVPQSAEALATKPATLGINLSKPPPLPPPPPPPPQGNPRNESTRSPSNGSSIPIVKFTSRLNEEPGPKPLPAGLQEVALAEPSDKQNTKLSDKLESEGKHGNVSSHKKPFSSDPGARDSVGDEDSSKWPPFRRGEERDPLGSPANSAGGPSSLSETGQDKSRLAAEPRDPSFRPMGQFGTRLPGGPPGNVFGQGAVRPGFRQPRGGHKGPPFHRGPPRMGDPNHNQGHTSWNPNHPRFGPPWGPPRSSFDHPPGRWPRPPR